MCIGAEADTGKFSGWGYNLVSCVRVCVCT